MVRRVDEAGKFLRWDYDTPHCDQRIIGDVSPVTGGCHRWPLIIERREQ